MPSQARVVQLRPDVPSVVALVLGWVVEVFTQGDNGQNARGRVEETLMTTAAPGYLVNDEGEVALDWTSPPSRWASVVFETIPEDVKHAHWETGKVDEEKYKASGAFHRNGGGSILTYSPVLDPDQLQREIQEAIGMAMERELRSAYWWKIKIMAAIAAAVWVGMVVSAFSIL